MTTNLVVRPPDVTKITLGCGVRVEGGGIRL
jgi:hypothetical protein